MAVAKPKPPVDEEEIDPEHPQYQHGMEAGLTAAGALAGLPRPAPAATPANDQQQKMLLGGGTALVNANMLTNTPGGALNSLPRPMGPTPAVGGTQAMLPPKIEPPVSLPRKRNQSAITQPNPADFFRR